MKAPYKNAIRSKAMIRKAMLTLLNKKQLSDISVTDIVKLANINRGTFYNHYNNPLEILEEIKNELIQKLSELLASSKTPNSIDDLLDVFNEYFLKNEKDYKTIVKSIPYSFVENIKYSFIQEVSKIDLGKTSIISVYFAVNGLIGLYMDYLKENLPFNSQDIITMSKEFVHKLFL